MEGHRKGRNKRRTLNRAQGKQHIKKGKIRGREEQGKDTNKKRTGQQKERNKKEKRKQQRRYNKGRKEGYIEGTVETRYLHPPNKKTHFFLTL